MKKIILLFCFMPLLAMEEDISSSENSEQLCRRAISTLFRERHDVIYTNIAPFIIPKLEKSRSEETIIDINGMIADTVGEVLEQKDKATAQLQEQNKASTRKTLIAAFSNVITAAFTCVTVVLIYSLQGNK